MEVRLFFLLLLPNFLSSTATKNINQRSIEPSKVQKALGRLRSIRIGDIILNSTSHDELSLSLTKTLIKQEETYLNKTFPKPSELSKEDKAKFQGVVEDVSNIKEKKISSNYDRIVSSLNMIYIFRYNKKNLYYILDKLLKQEFINNFEHSTFKKKIQRYGWNKKLKENITTRVYKNFYLKKRKADYRQLIKKVLKMLKKNYYTISNKLSFYDLLKKLFYEIFLNEQHYALIVKNLKLEEKKRIINLDEGIAFFLNKQYEISNLSYEEVLIIAPGYRDILEKRDEKSNINNTTKNVDLNKNKEKSILSVDYSTDADLEYIYSISSTNTDLLSSESRTFCYYSEGY